MMGRIAPSRHLGLQAFDLLQNRKPLAHILEFANADDNGNATTILRQNERSVSIGYLFDIRGYPGAKLREWTDIFV